MTRQTVLDTLRLIAEPFRLGGQAMMRGAVAAAIFLWLTAPAFWVLTAIRRRKPRKAKDSAFVYTMR